MVKGIQCHINHFLQLFELKKKTKKKQKQKNKSGYLKCSFHGIQHYLANEYHHKENV